MTRVLRRATPHAHFVEPPDETQGIHVRPRLYTTAQHRQHAGIATGIYEDGELNRLRGEWER